MTFLRKILLVAYEPRVTALVRGALEATGAYLVKEEHDSRLAFHAARWFQPDLILFDLASARPEAGAVAQQLREDPALRDTPVMFLQVDETKDGGVISGGVLSGYSFLANAVPIEELVRYVADLLYPKPAKNRNRQDALAG